jgi:hypothetical protein
VVGVIGVIDMIDIIDVMIDIMINVITDVMIDVITDVMIDFIILMKSKKIYKFSENIRNTNHAIKFSANNTNPSTEFRKEPHPTRHETEHPSDEPDWYDIENPYDPISEIIGRVTAEEIFEEYKDIKFVLTFQAACFQFDKRFFVKKPLRPGCPDFPFQTLNIIYEHQMLQVIRMLSEESLYSFQEMFILNEDKTEVIDYYAYRRRIKTLRV